MGPGSRICWITGIVSKFAAWLPGCSELDIGVGEREIVISRRRDEGGGEVA